MKIKTIYPNLKILNINYDGENDTKEHVTASPFYSLKKMVG